jgi:hypothetical protein
VTGRPSWQLLLAALGFALAGQLLVQSGWILAGFLAYLGLPAILLLSGAAAQEAPPAPVPGGPALLLLSGAVAVAFFLRRFQGAEIPWGLADAESAEGLQALRVLSGLPFTAFTDTDPPRETLYQLLLLPVFRFLGVGITTLRIPSLAAGIAAVLLVHLAGKALFSGRTGLIAAFLLAVSAWHVHFSRIADRVILVPVFLLAGVWLLVRALERRSGLLFVLAGIAFGGGMYTHPVFRIVPVAVILWMLLRSRIPGSASPGWRSAAALAGGFGASLLPQAGFALRNPAIYLSTGGGDPAVSLPAGLSGSLRGLLAAAFPAPRPPGWDTGALEPGIGDLFAVVHRAPLAAVAAALGMAGIVLALIRLARGKGEGNFVLILLFAVFAAGAGWGGAGADRFLGLAPWLALGGGIFLSDLFDAIPKTRGTLPSAAVLALLLAVSGALEYRLYFHRAGRSETAMRPFSYGATLIGLYAASRPPDHPVYVLHTGHAETIQFLTAPRSQWTVLATNPAAVDLDEVRKAIGRQAFVMQNDRRFLDLFRTLAESFPGAEATYLRHPFHKTGTNVAYVLDVGPGAREAPQEPGPDSVPAPDRTR